MTLLQVGTINDAFRHRSFGSPGHAGRIVLGAAVVSWIGVLSRASQSGFEPTGSATTVAAPTFDTIVGLVFAIAAMMLPLALPATRHVVASTFRAWQTVAATTFVASFLTVWVAFGLIVVVGVELLNAAGLAPAANESMVTALLVAAAWQLLPWKRTALRDCHLALPLPPRGWRSSTTCLRFGAVVAGRCIATCGGLMLPMLVGSSGHILLGLLATAAALCERRVLVLRRFPWAIGGGLLALALLLAANGSDPGSALVRWVCAIPIDP